MIHGSWNKGILNLLYGVVKSKRPLLRKVGNPPYERKALLG